MSKWPVVSIASLVANREASLQTGPFGTQLRAADYVETGIPVINVRNIGFGTIRPEKLEYISEGTRDRLGAHVLNKEDIVFGRKGAVERHVLIRNDQAGWLQGSDCIRLRIESERLLPAFASYFFLTSDHQRWMMNQCSHAATMASLNQGILERIELPLPPLPIQRRIAGILSAYDDLIENCERRIRVLDEMARALYQEWFVHLRYPGHETVPLVDSPMGRIPKGWEIRRVHDSFEILGGGTPSRKKPAYWDEGTITWFSPTDLTAAKTMFMDRSRHRITERGLAESSAKLFPPMSVMMTSRATIGAIAINTTEACTNQGFITCIPNERVPLCFLYHWLKDNVPLFERMASGSTFREISRGVFRTIEMLLPPEQLAKKFEKLSRPFAEQMLVLQRECDNLRQTRDLLLPRLLSGQLSVEKAA